MGKNPHQPKLVFVGEPFDGRVCELELETTTVGRSSQNHLCIQDPSVSAKHCEILTHDAEVILRDLKSSNGTFINAVRIEGQAQLKHGQIVRIGNVNARLELASPDASRTSSDATAVYQHAKLTREARAEREHPRPPQQPVIFEAGTGAQETGQTVALRKEPSGNKPSPTVQPAAPPASKGNSSRWAILGGLIALSAALWWLLRK